MENERAIEILDPEHREAYESLEPVNEKKKSGRPLHRSAAKRKTRKENFPRLSF